MEKQASDVVTSVDFVGNGLINYTEFLAATLDLGALLTEEHLWAIFNKFDTDESGFITRENINEQFRRLGRDNLTQEDIDQIM